ncbi:uncharacterized protein LOC115033548 [Acyrthosiphon pisum]|nr:uncharacterized protein LOC115033548 [Acyrthosiphon pisum]
MNLQNLSHYFIFLNHLQELDKSLDKKKMLLLNNLKNNRVRITNFMLVTSLYNDFDFKSHFRLNRNSVEVLMCKVRPFYISVDKIGRPKIDFEKATLMTIWYMSNTETFR